MKMQQLLLSACALFALAAALSGCSHASSAQPAVTKENFGYPGMKMSAGYYAVMKKVSAANANRPAIPASKNTPPVKQ